MAQAKVLKIIQVRFRNSVTLGRSAEVVDTIRLLGFTIDRHPISITFDQDNRFIRVTTLAPEPFINLVPISNVGSIVVDEV